MRLLLLKAAYRGIPIYKWYSAKKRQSGFAVSDFSDIKRYRYFASLEAAKKYIDEELSD